MRYCACADAGMAIVRSAAIARLAIVRTRKMCRLFHEETSDSFIETALLVALTVMNASTRTDEKKGAV